MDLLGNLTAIGFTEYEAKVYMALLRDNPANGYQVSSHWACRARWCMSRSVGCTRAGQC